jgi:histidyl-tRNA synthetase
MSIASIPKGTRDFLPSTMVKRNYIFDTLKTIFEQYGYSPIETPAIENLSTLMGKYGEEGDKLLFKILNQGLPKELSAQPLKDITSRGLRYDLTVPFARFVVQHRNDLIFPFKRYQIQPVWRGDRPQKGRYREFYQCDIDIIGNNGLFNEIELLEIIHRSFQKLGINITIKLNNRKVLAGIAEVIGETERLTDITVAIDKIDKIGIEKVKIELLEKGISQKSVEQLSPLLQFDGNTTQKITFLTDYLSSSEVGQKGIEELSYIFNFLEQSKSPILSELELDISLARGLNYYTGAIFEVKATDVGIGSITGGGRYDNLTGIFGLPDVSGVGISFGADRIYDVMEQLQLFPKDLENTVQILFVNFGEKELIHINTIRQKFIDANISSIVFPTKAKMKKQFDYANKNHIPFVAIIGEDELKNNTISLKDMTTGKQETISIEDTIEKLR